MDIRDRDPNAAKRWSDETVFSNRAYFLFDKLPGELAVQNAKDSDTGKYLMLKHVGEGRANVWRNHGARISEFITAEILRKGGGNGLPTLFPCFRFRFSRNVVFKSSNRKKLISKRVESYFNLKIFEL